MRPVKARRAERQHLAAEAFDERDQIVSVEAGPESADRLCVDLRGDPAGQGRPRQSLKRFQVLGAGLVDDVLSQGR